jgi:hypothetical protein
MFPPQSMDRLLKLKMEILYKDLPIEQARQHFDELREPLLVKPNQAVVVKRRKLRIPIAEEGK